MQQDPATRVERVDRALLNRAATRTGIDAKEAPGARIDRQRGITEHLPDGFSDRYGPLQQSCPPVEDRNGAWICAVGNKDAPGTGIDGGRSAKV